MRITEFYLEIEDVEWYGVDENNKIAQFTSGGSKMVPEFICESREKLDIICDYFGRLNHILSEDVSFSDEASKYSRKEYLEDCKLLSSKGIYCYDISDERSATSDYVLVCKPTSELLITDLPEDIQRIMRDYKISNAYFDKGNSIYVKKAY